jgi:hypothetical protein
VDSKRGVLVMFLVWMIGMPLAFLAGAGSKGAGRTAWFAIAFTLGIAVSFYKVWLVKQRRGQQPG